METSKVESVVRNQLEHDEPAASAKEKSEPAEYNTQSICLWKFGLQCPTSPPSSVWKVPLEEFDPQTQSPSLAPGELLDFTPALGCVTHLFYAYVRKATNTEFNVFVLGTGSDFWVVIHSLSNFAHLSKYASESVCVRFYIERSTL
ncbi:hypothetical protein F511_43680 [Dorcoceras hygrometricum]|uniref:Uncharacterized protein n=1 Tax=Dorcoceras hygrometricum TaxID=472368 RepID=A0A2Z7CBF7_9LAMI|nr:hypothetical protein F511_43680 [Dorcoceras hygrometricum]